MKTLRLAGAGLAVLLFLPTLFGLDYGAMLWRAATGERARPLETAAAPVPTPIPAPAVPAPPPGPPRDTALLDRKGLTAQRRVTVVRTIPFAAFLASGETAPHPAFRDLYAEARAGTLAAAECPRLVASLAGACRPLSVRAEPLVGGDYRVTLDLAFAPAEGLRPLAPNEAFERDADAIRLDVPAARNVAPAELGDAYAAIYDAARFACFDAWVAGAACALAELRIESAAGTAGTFDVTGHARLARSRLTEGG